MQKFLDGVRVFVGGLPLRILQRKFPGCVGWLFLACTFAFSPEGIRHSRANGALFLSCRRTRDGLHLVYATPANNAIFDFFLMEQAPENISRMILRFNGLRTFSWVLCMIVSHILYFCVVPRERYGPAAGIYSACVTAFMAWMSIIARSDFHCPYRPILLFGISLLLSSLLFYLQAALHAAVLPAYSTPHRGYALV